MAKGKQPSDNANPEELRSAKAADTSQGASNQQPPPAESPGQMKTEQTGGTRERDSKNGGQRPDGAPPAYEFSGLSAKIQSDNERSAFIKNFQGLKATAYERIERKANAQQIEDQITLAALVLDEGLPGEKTRKDVTVARAVISSGGGGAHLHAHPDLPEAVVALIYQEEGVNKIGNLKQGDIRDRAAQIFADVGPLLYKDRIAQALKDALNASPAADDVDAVYDLLMSARVPYAAPKFNNEVFARLESVRRDKKFERLFTTRDPGGDEPVATDLKKGFLSPRRRRQAISVLERIGVDPTRTQDRDWGRIALGILGSDEGDRDVMAMAGYGVGTGTDAIDFDLAFDEFEEEQTVGLISDNIRTCADLYYVHTFDRLGIFRVVDAIALKFFDRMNLGLSDAARKLYVYIKRRPLRFPEADRRKLTDAIFEGGASSQRGVFKRLMGRMVEALIEYTRVRNAGELFTRSDGNSKEPSVYTRSTVIRSIENLQRYLSDAGGGITHFLTRESGAQLMECFEILKSPDLRQYFGGDFRSGMWAVVEQVGKELDGTTPPVDRGRTLAVHGRRILRWLADNTANVGNLTDTDLDELSKHVQNWLAAYRRPEIEPDWLDEDQFESEQEEDIGEQAAREAVRSAAGEADILEEK